MKRWRITLFAFFIATVVLLACAWLRIQDLWVEPEEWRLSFVKSSIYMLSWLAFPILGVVLWVGIFGGGKWRKACFVLMLGLLLGIYARFIEPYRLVVEQHQISSTFNRRVAVVSDIHIGLYTSVSQLQKLVNKLNSLELDEVWVAGDWSYHPNRDIVSSYKPLSGLRHPLYWVPGNHDDEHPGPPLQPALRKGLDSFGLHAIENTAIDRDDFWLVGVGSLSAKHADFHALEQLPNNKPTIVLAHHPDVTEELPKSVLLTVVGHTHGGQVWVPFLTNILLSRLTAGGFDEGLYQTEKGSLFVSRGVGTVGLPLRLGNVPVIDVLEFVKE